MLQSVGSNYSIKAFLLFMQLCNAVVEENHQHGPKCGAESISLEVINPKKLLIPAKMVPYLVSNH